MTKELRYFIHCFLPGRFLHSVCSLAALFIIRIASGAKGLSGSMLKKRRLRALASAAGVFGLLSAGGLKAQDLSSANSLLSWDWNGQRETVSQGPVTSTLNAPNLPGLNQDQVFSNYNAGQNPVVGYGVNGSFTGSFESAQVATLTYDVRINGPGTQPLLVDFSTVGNLGWGITQGAGAADTTISVQLLSVTQARECTTQFNLVSGFGSNGGYTRQIEQSFSNGDGPPYQSFSQGGQIEMTPGTIYQITLDAQGNFQSSAAQTLGQFSSYVNIDPSFAIDPSNPNAGAYSIEYSVAAVPESGTWSLCLAGLTGLSGWMLKKRRLGAFKLLSVI